MYSNYVNTPCEEDVKGGHPQRNVWDTGGDGPFLSCCGYRVLGMLLMRAGAAFSPGLRDCIFHEFDHTRQQVAQSYQDMGTPGKLFVAQRLCEEVKRYDIHGGRTFRLDFQLPQHIVAQNGSRYRRLSNEMSSFTSWEQLCSRELLPQDERTSLRAMPKMWEMNGVQEVRYKKEEAKILPSLFYSMRKSATALALNARVGAESPLHVLAPKPTLTLNVS